ncbi:MAG: ATP-dependent helicase [Actinobacteria bacterium]|nr:ATP-dependent helicase [Actinomycetota bacterium]
MEPSGALAAFSAPTRAWFTGAFAGPTAAQEGTWAAVAGGRHALVVAPTGSGKTLAAFLWAIDSLVGAPPPQDPATRCRVLYVSPLKALTADVERNLRSPLVGIGQAAARAGLPVPEIEVQARTGDTPPAQRRAFATRPPDILVTTPESLYLLLTSQARAGLAGVRTVIVDEIHAVTGTKRGAHLALSLERLDALLSGPGGPGPAQRVGLSATVRPVEDVAGFLTGSRTAADGGREVVIVQPPSHKLLEVDVVVPVPDLTDLVRPGDPDGPDGADASDGRRRASVWPHVEERVVDLVAAHRSTLVFTNSRRTAERLTARVNEVWAQRHGVQLPEPGSLAPAQAPGQSGTSVGVDTRDATTIVARAHHGSMSRAERTRTESELKAGRLPAVVATSSLELGIDMGAVDLVVQIGAPPSVASGLQRIGRAGHQVGAVSHGVVLPTHRGELVAAAVGAERMRAGAIEALHVPANPLDVLAQQVVAMVATDDWQVAELAAVVRRAAPFTTLGEATLRAVLDMLAGRYPSEEFAELRPRLVWDRATDVLTARPGALRLAVTSGGTIPDRGLYGVFLAPGSGGTDVPTDAERTGGRLRGGRRVGELDEEMVYESRVGDTFTLGSSTWRVEDITPDRVLVSPAPGVPGRLPFWKGDSPGRPAELGAAMGAWVREVSELAASDARRRVQDAGLDPWATDNLLAYLAEQRAATGRVPTDRVIVLERFRDELGDWRIVLHSPYGAKVHAPWALVVAARLRERFGVDVAALHSDDGIVLRLPDVLDGPQQWDDPRHPVHAGDASGPQVQLADLLLEPDEVAGAVRAELASSAMFAARFREAAARALLLPRRRPDRRQPLWAQRQRAAQLLQVASGHPDFPILLEAVRECLRDDFDIAALSSLMADVAARRVTVHEVTTTRPSPFAQSLMFGYTAQFLYEGDAPLAERRAAALTLDPTLLAELLGGGGGSQLADLLDPQVVERTAAELMGTAPDRRAGTLEQLADVLRRHGPLPRAAVLARTSPEQAAHVAGWLTELVENRRVIEVRLSGVPPDEVRQWAAVEDAGRLRDALGVALPVGVPEVFTEVVADPLGDLLRRHARTHGPFTARSLAARFGLTPALVARPLELLVAAGHLVDGRLLPEVLGGVGEELCDAGVLRMLRRRSLAALRAQVEPVDPRAMGVFLPRWQQVVPIEPDGGGSGHGGSGHGGATLSGVEGVARAIEQLAGAALPASAWETHVLPARVPDYAPSYLDELTAAGEVLWAGHGQLAGHDALVSFHPVAVADLTLPPQSDEVPDGPAHTAVLAALAGGGGWFVEPLAVRVRELLEVSSADQPITISQAGVLDALWDLVWAGLVTNDSLAPLRAWLGTGTTAHRTRPSTPRGRTMPGRLGLRPGWAVERGGPDGAAGRSAVGGARGRGRWSLLPPRQGDPTLRAHAVAAQLLDRHGLVSRALAPTERLTGAGFSDVYRVLAALEQAGQVRRGYFVENLGGSQFALPGAVDRLRADAETVTRSRERAGEPVALPVTARDEPPVVVVLAATDPANPYGAALPWPEREAGGHRPGRKAGALVVLVDGEPALYVERGARTLLSGTDEPSVLELATRALVSAADARGTSRLTVGRVDGAPVPGEGTATPAGQALLAAGFRQTPRGLRWTSARG